MKRSVIIYTGKAILFLCIGLVLFRGVSVIFLEKSSYPKYRSYLREENVDVLILGSSHSENGLHPGLMEDGLRKRSSAELSVFNYSIYGMRVEQMRFFLKMILKKKVPDVIVLETFAFLPLEDENREILARRAFDAFPFRMIKTEAIPYCVKENPWSYYIPFMKYHSRWKELRPADVEMLFREELWGYSAAVKDAMEPVDDYFSQDTSQMEETQEITDTERESIGEILALAREKGIRVLFVSVPFKEQLGMDSLEMIRVNNYLREHYVDGRDVKLLDMNRMWKELDFGYSDLYNEGHCNRSGCRKVTKALVQYMAANYDCSDWEG